MQLSDLGLNRFLYKDTADTTNEDDVGDVADSANNSSGTGASSGILPGSPPIVSVLLQSSPGPNRVEINPNDNFYAYNKNQIVVDINKDGINIKSPAHLTINGVPQPTVFAGIIEADGTAIILPAGWTSVRNSVGNYTITHNLNTTIPFMVTFAPMNGHFRCSQNNRTANSFDVDWEQTNYGSATFPVTGGGGGSVTVDGVRIPPDEVQVDTRFEFIFVQFT